MFCVQWDSSATGTDTVELLMYSMYQFNPLQLMSQDSWTGMTFGDQTMNISISNTGSCSVTYGGHTITSTIDLDIMFVDSLFIKVPNTPITPLVNPPPPPPFVNLATTMPIVHSVTMGFN